MRQTVFFEMLAPPRLKPKIGERQAPGLVDVERHGIIRALRPKKPFHIRLFEIAAAEPVGRKAGIDPELAHEKLGRGHLKAVDRNLAVFDLLCDVKGKAQGKRGLPH